MGNLKIPDAPVGELDEFDKQVKLMFDLLALAYQADSHAVASYIMGAVAEGPPTGLITTSGFRMRFHPVSHHANDIERINKLVKIQSWHVEKFAEFIAKMAATQDGQGERCWIIRSSCTARI